MNKKYKINEVARIFGISRQTLIHYDKIGLFHPDYVDETNSYRYYSQKQFFYLRFILILKNSGFSLSEIKEYTKTESPQESQAYLEGKVKDLEEKIAFLTESKNIINRKIKEVKNITQKKREPAKFVNLKEQRIFKFTLNTLPSFENFDKTFYEAVKKKDELGIEGEEFFEELNRKSIEVGDYMQLISIGFFIPKDMGEVEGEEHIKGGKHATIVHMDTWTTISESYKRLEKFIQTEGYTISGDPIEVFNNINVHLGKGEGTTVKIFIPVVKI